VFDASTSNKNIFEAVEHIMSSAKSGRHVMYFASGESGSGKLSTMLTGLDLKDGRGRDASLLNRILSNVVGRGIENQGWTVRVRAIEVYLGNDLYNIAYTPTGQQPNKRRVKSRIREEEARQEKKERALHHRPATGEQSRQLLGINAANAQDHQRFVRTDGPSKGMEMGPFVVAKGADIDNLIGMVDNQRTKDETEGNKTSSRGHCWLELRIFYGDQEKGIITLVDLAGMEDMQSKTSKLKNESTTIRQRARLAISLLLSHCGGEALGQGPSAIEVVGGCGEPAQFGSSEDSERGSTGNGGIWAACRCRMWSCVCCERTRRKEQEDVGDAQ
jgi:hypothetical protein